MGHDSELRINRRGLSTAFTIVAMVVGAPGCAAARGTSGIYVGASGGQVEMVQIVETSDGHVAGRIEDVTVGADGSVSDNAIAVEGAADGSQITLSPKSGLLSLFGASLTANVEGNQLFLSWQGGHSALRRSDLHGFEQAANSLRQRASMIVAEKAAESAARAREAAVQALLNSASR